MKKKVDQSLAQLVLSYSKKPKAAQERRAQKKVRRAGQRRPGIGAFVKECLRQCMTTDEVLNAVKRKFPEAATTRRNIDFYRCQLKKSTFRKT